MHENIRIFEKHSLILRISHWINLPLVMMTAWSGVLIYWANPIYLKVPDQIGPWRIHHRLAEGMGWHFLLIWPLVFNGIGYFTYLALSGHWREIFPYAQDWKSAIPYVLYDLKIKKTAPPYTGMYNPVQKIAYMGAIFLGLGTVASGLAIFKPVQLGWLTALLGGYEAARLEHFICLLGFMLFIIVHIIQVIRAGWNNFRAMIAGYEIHED